MAKETKPVNAEVADVESNEELQEVQEVVAKDNFAAICKRLLKSDNCSKITGIEVKTVTVNDDDERVKVNFSLKSKIPGFVQVFDADGDPTGEYKKGETSVIFSTSFAIGGVLKNNEELALAGNTAVTNPRTLVALLSGSKLDVIQQFVPANTPYTNPFTTKDNAETREYDHDIIINHIVKIELGIMGKKLLDKVLDRYVDAFVI